MFRVGSIFIPVTNLEEASVWYEKNLGVKKIQGWGEGSEKGIGYYFSDGSTQLGLVQVKKAASSEFHVNDNIRNAYFNFLVEDIESVYNQLRSNGVNTTPLEDFGGMTCFDFYDLDGNSFSVVNEVKDSPFHTDHVKKLQQSKV
ncbi:VOC family protein [Guptibacillus hwajinpoensis]|uniref:Enzyme related to lactoylglutathione lyase n=1 Tax=Guptibacillus hwajinpoensis TaxID=208199 RepID=A0ABU0K663_9BACL|nr:VOC family protein [Alkalihalobacillus hemicentroti]MDQ0483789.1 putative enzyme related to lactoylglutathione lyase [Alkalihalobacillus hemicentroti]